MMECVLVPVEPTEKMMRVDAPPIELTGDFAGMKYRRGIWSAMLAAAPKVEQEPHTTHKEVMQQALEALEHVRNDLVTRAEIDLEDGGAVLDISNGSLLQMDEAIAALRALENDNG